MTMFANVNGHALQECRISVPRKGPWFADVTFQEAPDIAGKVILRAGETEWHGTVVPSANGEFGLQRRCRIVAGGGGWGHHIPAWAYHNDALVRARTVAEDAARTAGEVLGGFAPEREKLAANFAREAGPASQALEAAIGNATWWVDRNGVTQVGQRASVNATGVTVLDYDPRDADLTLSADELTTIDVGSVIRDSALSEPLTISALEISITNAGIIIHAWCGVGAVTEFADLLQSTIRRTIDERLLGAYRYEVVRMIGKRVDLKATRTVDGVPNLLSIEQYPGVAGVHADLEQGAIVLVTFVAGDRTDPVITGYIGGHQAVPPRLEIGGSPAPAAARQGDTVECMLPPAVFSGLINGAPASGVLTFPLMKIQGTVTGGSGKVGIGT